MPHHEAAPESRSGTTSSEETSEKKAFINPLSKILKPLSFPRGIRMAKGFRRSRRGRFSRRYSHRNSDTEL